ncbi:NTP transferase domain-containing protein [Leucobacter allii]|uniref:NTP transferase domain-containing protein n=1 Tax=Leucobacter allii TaxID=2932247 RepID=A0ABY4FMY5_9MICO|nr:NTP transferase domain-containing protein [Leucobacter allii]UOQ57650.1 NTP transferase domain-containing protein [Leucobacter allii]
MDAALWHAVVPIRSFGSGKQRLRAVASGPAVDAVAERLALRTLDALEGASRVAASWVVTDEESDRFAGLRRVEVLREARADGLNSAVRRGLEAVRERAHGREEPRILVLHADLPFITPEAIDAVLRRWELSAADAYVPDRRGDGTTALGYHPGSARPPMFGPGSARRHSEAGFARTRLPEAHPLRSDLDTRDQLVQYLRSGAADALDGVIRGLDLGLHECGPARSTAA